MINLRHLESIYCFWWRVNNISLTVYWVSTASIKLLVRFEILIAPRVFLFTCFVLSCLLCSRPLLTPSHLFSPFYFLIGSIRWQLCAGHCQTESHKDAAEIDDRSLAAWRTREGDGNQRWSAAPPGDGTRSDRRWGSSWRVLFNIVSFCYLMEITEVIYRCEECVLMEIGGQGSIEMYRTSVIIIKNTVHVERRIHFSYVRTEQKTWKIKILYYNIVKFWKTEKDIVGLRFNLSFICIYLNNILYT